MFRTANRMRRWLAIALAIGLFCSSVVLAKKPDKPPGGEDPAAGVIYFRYQDQVWTMNADGSGKTAVPNTAFVFGSPSRNLHGNQRWFLEMDELFPFESYPDFERDEDGNPILDENGDPVVKHGAHRKEISAVSEDGQLVQLTTQPDLEILAAPVWGLDDGYVSWVARRWDDNPASATFGTVLEGGLYTAELEYDGDGNVTGLEQQPGAPLVSISLVPSDVMRSSYQPTLAPDINDHSWSPDAAQFVFDVHSAAELWICDLLAPPEEAFRLLQGPQGKNLIRPRWSPAGDKIVFEDVSGHSALCTVSADGTGLKTIASGSARGPVVLPFWSPTGSHVLYHVGDYRALETNIVRADADGGSRTNLTRDISSDGQSQVAIGWR